MTVQKKPFWLHALFPTHCPFCGEVLLRTQECCADCMEQLQSLRLYRTARDLPYLQGLEGLYRYEDGVRHAVFLMKFRSDRDAGSLLGDALGRMVKNRFRERNLDVIIPVPISKRRRFTRGYNQAEWLADGVAIHTGLPVAAGALQKNRHTPDQHELTAIDRRKNLLGVFHVPDPSLIRGKTVLLVDDVCTSGWTASLCAQALLQAGAEQVYAAVVAVADRQKQQ